VSPQSGRSAAEGVALEPSTKSLDLVPDFEWPETGFTNRKLDRRIFRPAFPTLQAANVPRERPSQFSRQTERSPPVNPYGDNYSNRDNRRIRIGIDDSVVALRCAEWTLGTAGPSVAGEFAHGAEVGHEDGIAGPEQLGIQVRPLAEDEGDHAPVTPAGLTIVLVYERLRPDRARLVREFLRLGIARLSNLRTIHEREPDPSGTDVKRVAVHDIGHGIREASGRSPALRASHRRRIDSRRVAPGW